MKRDREISRIIKGYDGLPSMPGVLLKLVEGCTGEDATIEDLSKIISVDPALCARTIHMANAPSMGGQETITSVAKAVSRLGEDVIKNLATTALVRQAFGYSRWNSLMNLTLFWRESLLCAAIARRVAQKTSYPRPEEAFLAGLLREIGKLLLLVTFSEEYAAVLHDAADDSDLLVQEKEGFGVTHCEVGAWLIRQWDPKSLMADAVLYHQEPRERILDAFPLVKIVYVAHALCQNDSSALLAGVSIVRAMFGFGPSQVEEIVGDANKEVAQVAGSFGIRTKGLPLEEVAEGEKRGDKQKDLLYEVRDVSLLSGTLQNLLRADCRDAVLRVVEQSLQILFHVEKVFFFLYVQEKDVLVGMSPHRDDRGGPITGLEIAAQNDRSLIARSLAKRMFLDSFGHPEPVTMTIAEEEIVRLAGTEGILCIPMLVRGQNVGVIVAGTSESQFLRLTGKVKLLNMFANHVATSLHVEEMKKESTRETDVSQQLDAAATIAHKIGHEVNNRLGIMKNYIKILGMKLPQEDSALDELKIIGEEIDRVSQIADQLSDFSREKMRQFAPVSIEGLLSGLLKILDVSILRPNDIVAHLSLDARATEIVTDEDALKQVLINLIKNAAEAMPRGGNIHLRTERINTPPQGLDMADTTKASWGLEITVSDDGPGMPDHIKSRLFEAYNTSKGGDHSGLGLSIVHNIVEELSGTISCESGRDRGTTFRIVLPLP
ncbi:MAG: HDOD domain-containing protein [Thermodesulfobacteriota bacterium]|nr:HDOD domain-containing protein [Thermodesulfobacteriota bacterium]